MRNRSSRFIEFFEQHIFVRILSLFIVFAGSIFWVLEKFQDCISKTFVHYFLWQFILSAIGALAIFGIGYLLIDCFDKKRKTNLRLIINPTEIFENELSQSSRVRIFASNGEAAKSLFLAFHRKNLLMHNLNVQVLLRSINGDTGRESQLKTQAQRWKSDVDNLLSNSNPKMQTSFKLYECPVMLSGYIFDNRVAMLAWYSRPRCTNRHRSLPNPPLFYLSSEDPDSKKLLEEAIKLFDCHYNSGKELQ